jgi:hypothetical protein
VRVSTKLDGGLRAGRWAPSSTVGTDGTGARAAVEPLRSSVRFRLSGPFRARAPTSWPVGTAPRHRICRPGCLGGPTGPRRHQASWSRHPTPDTRHPESGTRHPASGGPSCGARFRRARGAWCAMLADWPQRTAHRSGPEARVSSKPPTGTGNSTRFGWGQPGDRSERGNGGDGCPTFPRRSPVSAQKRRRRLSDLPPTQPGVGAEKKDQGPEADLRSRSRAPGGRGPGARRCAGRRGCRPGRSTIGSPRPRPSPAALGGTAPVWCAPAPTR